MTVRQQKRESGFTLIELVVSIVIAGILSTFLANIIATPMQAHNAMARRAALVDVTEHAMRRMGREIRAAVPNSVRTATDGNHRFLEYIHTVDAGLYRVQASGAGTVYTTGDGLDVATSDTTFTSMGPLRHLLFRYPDALGGNPDLRVVIYNVNNETIYTDFSNDNGNGLISRQGLALTDNYNGGPEQLITLVAGQDFATSSPYQRFFLVDYPATFHCDPDPGAMGAGTGLLTMFWNYHNEVLPHPYAPVFAADPFTDTGGPNETHKTVLANNVVGCEFRYDDATNQRSGLVEIELQLQDPHTLNTVTLLHLIHVESAP